MLVLSRKIGESLIINDDIVITVLSVRGETVRIGATAPSNISIHREEVYQRIQHQSKKENDALLKHINKCAV